MPIALGSSIIWATTLSKTLAARLSLGVSLGAKSPAHVAVAPPEPQPKDEI
jgi:hypothetical protein